MITARDLVTWLKAALRPEDWARYGCDLMRWSILQARAHGHEWKRLPSDGEGHRLREAFAHLSELEARKS